MNEKVEFKLVIERVGEERFNISLVTSDGNWILKKNTRVSDAEKSVTHVDLPRMVAFTFERGLRELMMDLVWKLYDVKHPVIFGIRVRGQARE